MGWLLADVLQNCVRMDGGHTPASTVGLTTVWLLTIFLHNYVIRMDVCRTIGFTMGCTLAELGFKLFERLYHGYKKHQLILATLQVQPPNARYPNLLARLHRLQAYIRGQHVDDPHQHSELHELCLEVDAYGHELHELCQSHELCNCTNPCTNLCSRLGSRLNYDEVANASGGRNSDGLPGLQEEAAAN